MGNRGRSEATELQTNGIGASLWGGLPFEYHIQFLGSWYHASMEGEEEATNLTSWNEASFSSSCWSHEISSPSYGTVLSSAVDWTPGSGPLFLRLLGGEAENTRHVVTVPFKALILGAPWWVLSLETRCLSMKIKAPKCCSTKWPEPVRHSYQATSHMPQ